MANPWSDIEADAANHVRYWQGAGVRNLAMPQAETAAVQAGGQPATAPAVTSPNAADTLESIAAELDGCRRCGLCDTRTNLVFGVGSPEARVVFVGEAPGNDEDLQGEPFVGRSGQLLTDIIEKGMGIPRASVYICNTVKCRPPENRNPQTDELAACEPYLLRQLATIRPEVIVTLGKFAAQALLRTDTPISRLRGHWQEYESMALMPTYHPAYMLRNPSSKRDVWADIQQVMARLGIARGGK
ncbi:MAG: uracil-DNA glycosylase family protein [Leptospirillia bacterium]